jgi:hypothetical protein
MYLEYYKPYSLEPLFVCKNIVIYVLFCMVTDGYTGIDIPL